MGATGSDARDGGATSAWPGDAPEPVLPAGACFEGLVSLGRSARIDGRVRGDVVAVAVVVIGESGCVEGRLEADEVVVAGELVGEALACTRIELLPTARVRAHLHAPRLIAAEGCFLEGPCEAGAAAGSSGPPEPTAPPRDARSRGASTA